MNKLGLCLSGGGARGAYQVGVCKALEDLGYFSKIHAISGTSIGAVNASLLATKPIKEVKELWTNFPIDEFNYIEGLLKRIRVKDYAFVKKGIMDIENLQTLLDETLDVTKFKDKLVFITLSPAGLPDEGTLGILKASFKHYIMGEKNVIYSSLKDQKPEDINKQIISSCSIPFVFAPVNLNGNQMFDGGLYDNTPIKPLVDAGCDTVILVNLQRLMSYNPKKFPGIKVIEIKHNKSLGAILNFAKDQSMTRFDLGYLDAMEYFTEFPLI